MKFTIREGSSGFVWSHRILDFIIPPLSLYLLNLSTHISWHIDYALLGTLGGVILVVSSQLIGVYNSWRARPLIHSLKLVFRAWLISWASLIVLIFLFEHSQIFSRLNLTLWAVVVPLTLATYRFSIRKLLSKYSGRNKHIKKVAILGSGTAGDHLQEVFKKNSWLGYKVIGTYDDESENAIGTIEDAIQDAMDHKFNEIFICLPIEHEYQIKAILDRLTNTSVIVKYVPDLFTFDLMHANWIDIQGIPIISVYDTPLNSMTSKLIKRIEDISISTLIIILTLPLMIFVAIGIKLTSPGPIFYRQTRIGWNGQPFSIIKFRSMPINADTKHATWGKEEIKANTKFGLFIRRRHFDELPQFFNVLKGEMSIVGPRPERDIFVDKFRNEIPRYMQKHMVKAGITGWAQINDLKGDTSLEKRIEYDLHYIKSWSPMLDLKIILITLFKWFK